MLANINVLGLPSHKNDQEIYIYRCTAIKYKSYLATRSWTIQLVAEHM